MSKFQGWRHNDRGCRWELADGESVLAFISDELLTADKIEDVAWHIAMKIGTLPQISDRMKKIERAARIERECRRFKRTPQPS